MKTRELINDNGNVVKAVVIVQLNNGDEIMMHYGTAVCGRTMADGLIRTDTFHSNTTSKHINTYCGGKNLGEKVTQDYLDKLVESI